MAKSRCAAISIACIFSFLWFYIFFGLFCGVFVIGQNAQIAMKILNIFEEFFNKAKERYSEVSNPVVHPFWSKCDHFLMMVNVLHCQKLSDFDFFILSQSEQWCCHSIDK